MAWMTLATAVFIFWLATVSCSSFCFASSFFEFNYSDKAWIFSLEVLLVSIVAIKSFLRLEASASNGSTLDVTTTAFLICQVLGGDVHRLPQHLTTKDYTIAQTLVLTFSFPLLPVLRFFARGATSSIEMPGEAARPSSRVGVDEPFSAASSSFSFLMTLNLRWPILERDSFFLAFIRAYNS